MAVATPDMIARTSDKDRGDHPEENSAQIVGDLSRLDDDGGSRGGLKFIVSDGRFE
jgi:hypothetical protein